MNANEFKTGAVKADELGDAEVIGRVTAVNAVELDGVRKMRITVEGLPQGVILNQTRIDVMVFAFGPDTDDWIGKKVGIGKGLTTFKKKQVDCITLRAPVETDTRPDSKKNGKK